MLLDEEIEYDEAELDRAVEPVDADDPWGDSDANTDNSSGSGSGSADDAADDTGDDETGSLTDFTE